jgi:predicted RecB family endonuclease
VVRTVHIRFLDHPTYTDGEQLRSKNNNANCKGYWPIFLPRNIEICTTAAADHIGDLIIDHGCMVDSIQDTTEDYMEDITEDCTEDMALDMALDTTEEYMEEYTDGNA